LGIEQEFFIIDRGFYYSRPDLIACGRTLLGAKPPKGQQMEDHYFGSVEKRILAFLQDAEWTLWRLGVPMKTRHNEVAPSQYEMAPIFEDISVACDHNMLTMEILRDLAAKHGFACLLHEKPFAGVNGSGKHNNWSISTDTGENLFDPGDTPAKNARFMAFLSALLRGVYLNGDLLRVGITTPGNDHRLGANEAPPAILSVFIGQELANVVEDIIDTGTTTSVHDAEIRKKSTGMQLGVNALPSLPKDTTDRNRTSAVAFTGNKFEFRAVGSSQNSARPGTMLNTVLADSINFLCEGIEKELKQGKSRQDAVHLVVSKTLKDYKGAIFNGNNYSDDWIKEAEKRKLWNLRTSPEAIQQLDSKKNVEIFKKTGVLSEKEVHAHKEILYEHYSKVMSIEGQCMYDMVQTSVIPPGISYQNIVAAVQGKTKTMDGYLSGISGLTSELISRNANLKKTMEEAERMDDLHKKATFYRGAVTDAMQKTRETADELETIVDNKLWAFPKYAEMLFMK
jgi:glutamine synthetase